ncbi:hypothetical protein P154DRAFT_604662 [Amniculicola lignicola CBS 123094]|uniref:Uncharacterized protein n=1 Tax=Amniculicola lignicola CBS 123094 TaxID=1392246 RepID=A0A6A5WB65_9PLEO|nr:hypothetical protein P154DRAFT_604662 [Amniculicola lignicola CBS 123094]
MQKSLSGLALLNIDEIAGAANEGGATSVSFHSPLAALRQSQRPDTCKAGHLAGHLAGGTRVNLMLPSLGRAVRPAPACRRDSRARLSAQRNWCQASRAWGVGGRRAGGILDSRVAGDSGRPWSESSDDVQAISPCRQWVSRALLSSSGSGPAAPTCAAGVWPSVAAELDGATLQRPRDDPDTMARAKAGRRSFLQQRSIRQAQ